MRTRQAIVALLVAALLLVGLSFLPRNGTVIDDMNPNHDKQGRFAWYYPRWSQYRQDLDGAITLGFTDLFVSVNARSLLAGSVYFNSSYDNQVDQLVRYAGQFDLRISLMILQDPTFYNRSDPAKLHLDGVSSFVNRHGGITGFHYDIEPHTAAEWNATSRELIFPIFIDTLLELGSYAQEQGLDQLEASMAVPWWFNEQALDDRYPSALTEWYDFLVFMVYGGIGDSIEDYLRVEDELAVIDGVLGFGYQEFGNSTATLEFGHQLASHYADWRQVRGTSLYRLTDVL